MIFTLNCISWTNKLYFEFTFTWIKISIFTKKPQRKKICDHTCDIRYFTPDITVWWAWKNPVISYVIFCVITQISQADHTSFHLWFQWDYKYSQAGSQCDHIDITDEITLRSLCDGREKIMWSQMWFFVWSRQFHRWITQVLICDLSEITHSVGSSLVLLS